VVSPLVRLFPRNPSPSCKLISTSGREACNLQPKRLTQTRIIEKWDRNMAEQLSVLSAGLYDIVIGIQSYPFVRVIMSTGDTIYL
jgi:hypothetical protein